MSIRFNKFTRAVALGAVALPFVGCFDTDQTCEDLGTCSGGIAAGAGGGTSGGAGRAGAGGAAAHGGQGGETGAAGATGGASNAGGKSGAGGKGGSGAGKGGTGTGGTGAGAAGEAGNGGEGGPGGAGTGSAPCDPTKTPDEDSCVIDEDYGVFVSPTGSDTAGTGSRAKPFATLTKAIDQATSTAKRVYACADAGTYQETLDLDSTTSGLALYGGFACADWSYSTSTRSRLSSPAALALHVSNVTGLLIEDFRIDAADATAPGESSVGVFVANSTGVVIGRTMITAGKGGDGADGTLDAFTYQAQSALDGNSESPATMGGAEKVCSCQTALMSLGGIGGAPVQGGQNGSAGFPNYGGGQAGTPGSCASGGAGFDGANAPTLSPGPGATTLGSLDATGWTPSPGQDGQTGQPGQGGGGGASRNASGHGGGGGCGGCGGNGGSSSQGGGASIALLVVDSELTIETGTLSAADGGKGGDGHGGQPAQMDAGVGGSVVNAFNSCPGGNGGLGADGSSSGGAAGGVSIGILWKGNTAPSESGLTITTGTAGSKGLGGDPGVNDGIDGTAQDSFEAS
jgi:hypothetical protein